MSDKPAETKANLREAENRSQSGINVSDQEAATLLELAGAKKPSKAIYRGLYYLMIVLALWVIGIGTHVAIVSGMTGRLNFSLGAIYFGMVVVLLCLAIYFKTKAR